MIRFAWMGIIVASVAWAQPPLPSITKASISIDGPTSVQKGKSVVLSVPADLVGDSVNWLVDGTSAYITSNDETSRRLAILDIESDVVVVFISWDKQVSGLRRIKVGPAGPDTPPDKPDHPDKPDKPVIPIPPSDLTGLAKESFGFAMKVSAAVRRAEGAKLATILEEVASPVAAGTQTTVYQMMQSLDQQIPPAIDEAAWSPWGIEFQKARRAWQETGTTPADVAEKLVSMAKGVRAAGGQP
jgi:hypothetical protein